MAESSLSNPLSTNQATSPSQSGEGSSRASVAPVVPDEKTVISKKTPLPAPAEAMPSLRPSDIGKSLEGQQLGQFLLEEFVGGGGMGAVFRGVDTTLDRTVAIKVVSTEGTDEDTLRRFRNEAQSAARLDHPNIARVYSVGEENGWNYIVFEFIQGVNVRDLVQHKGPLPLDEAVSYLIQAAQALEHASQRDVVHRDIKPSNLLVMEDGRAKLVDMGLARLHHVDSSSEDITATGVTLGTFDYISPEQARDPRDTDVRSDLYSLGCTFYYMLTGMPPFPEGTVLQKLLSHSSEEAPDPRDLRDDLPESISAVALKLMAKQPSQRYQRPSEVMKALVSVCEELGLAAPTRAALQLAPGDSPGVKVAYHLPWMVPLFLLFIIVFGVDALLPEAQDISPEEMLPTVTAGAGSQSTAGAAVPPEVDSPNATESDNDEGPSENSLPEQTPSATESEPESPANDLESLPAEKSNREIPPFVDSVASLEVELTEASIEFAPQALVNTFGPDETDTEAAPGSATDDAAAAVAAEPSRLVVFPDSPPTTNPLVVPSLDEAIRRLDDLPAVNVIELRFDRYRVQPLTIDLRREITIEAADQYRPVIVFERSQADVLGDKRMIYLLGGTLNLKGVHFQVSLPYASADGWSLFYLNQVKEIALSNCTLTMKNDYRADAAFFDVRRPRTSDMTMPGEEKALPSRPNIVLDSCVARGQATLVRATDGLPFNLHLTNDLLATTERMIELGPAVRLELARIRLRHVTALMQQGLCRVRVGETDSKVPQLDIVSENCLLDHNPASPLIEHVGVRSVESTLHSALRLAGQRNAYPGTEICWRIHAEDTEPLAITWEQRREPSNAWYAEGVSERYAPWVGGGPEPVPVMYEVTPDRFRVEDEMAGKDEFYGFDFELLPALPELVERTVTDD